MLIDPGGVANLAAAWWALCIAGDTPRTWASPFTVSQPQTIGRLSDWEPDWAHGREPATRLSARPQSLA